MSFFWPHDATVLTDSLLSSLPFEDPVAAEEFAALWGDQHRSLEDQLATQTFLQLPVFTLDGAGAATVAHGLAGAFTLLFAQAWYQGASPAEFLPATIAGVDATNVTVSGGGVGQTCTVTLVYSTAPPAW